MTSVEVEMSRWGWIWVGCGLLAACNTTRDPELVGQAAAFAEQATEERWRFARVITRCDGETAPACRLAPPWRSQRLFKSSGTLPPPDAGQRTFWVHEWRNEQTALDLARAIQNAGNDLALAPPRAQPMADLDSLRAAVVGAWKGPAGAVAGRIEGAAVRVVVLDTAPRGARVGRDFLASGGHPHGVDLARIVEQAVCGSGVGCPVKVQTELALDLIPGRAGAGSRVGAAEVGGAFGDPGSVAVAVHRATERWLAEGAEDRLVLVIPSGWVAAPGDPGAEAARLALVQARCFGALVVAAYGNAEDGGGEDRGPLCPACFAEEPACDAAGPLVWAAAGAQRLPDGELGALPNGRAPGAKPPAVFGYGHLVRPAGGLGTYSGSSVGAALAAAALAVVWSGLDATGVAGADAALAASAALAAEGNGFLAPCRAAGQGCAVGALVQASPPAGCVGGACVEAQAPGDGGLEREAGAAARPLCELCALSGETVVISAHGLPAEEAPESLRAVALKVVRADGKVDRYPLALDGVARAALVSRAHEERVAGVRGPGGIRSAELVGILEWPHPDREVSLPRTRSFREAVFIEP